MANSVIANYGLTLGFLSAIITGVAKQFFDARAAEKRWERDRADREQQHQWELEARREAGQTLAGHVEAGTSLMRDHDAWEREEHGIARAQAEQVAARLEESRALIVEAIDRAKDAYREANDMNRKLERLAGGGIRDEGKAG